MTGFVKYKLYDGISLVLSRKSFAMLIYMYWSNIRFIYTNKLLFFLTFHYCEKITINNNISKLSWQLKFNHLSALRLKKIIIRFNNITINPNSTRNILPYLMPKRIIISKNSTSFIFKYLLHKNMNTPILRTD